MEGSPGVGEQLRFFLPSMSARAITAEQRLEATLDEAARELEQIDRQDALYSELHAHRGQGLPAARQAWSDATSVDSRQDRR